MSAVIVDYSSLSNALKVYCARSDNVFNTQIPTFVSFAEERIVNGVGEPNDSLYSEALRVPEMYQEVSIPSVSEQYAIPGDCLSIRVVDFGGTLDPEYMAPDQFRTLRNTPESGATEVVYYTIEGQFVRVYPSREENMSMGYWQRPTFITSSSPTNQLLFNGSKYGNLYLAAAMFEALTWLQKEGAEAWLIRFRSAVSGANKSAEGVRRGGGKRRMTPVVTIGANLRW